MRLKGYPTMKSNLEHHRIEGVHVRPLLRHTDARGYFEEILRVSDPVFEGSISQWSHSLMHPGVLKAWHIHHKQTDWWYVPIGRLLVALHDLRCASSTFGMTQELYLGEDVLPQALKIPPDVAHGCYVVSRADAHLFYVTSHIYDPEDEGRIPYNDKSIGYEWPRNITAM